LLSTEIVKKFHSFPAHLSCAEPTVQQEETPQPPPEKPPEGNDGEGPLPGPEEQQKEDIIFFTFFDEHLGHLVSFCPQDMRWSRENLSSHSLQMYS
jgi:hypothetical protein